MVELTVPWEEIPEKEIRVPDLADEIHSKGWGALLFLLEMAVEDSRPSLPG